MMNRVVLTGRLTKEPDLRYTPNGVAVATFTLAVNRTYTNQQGEREADFINVVVWRKSAENCANYLKKGSLVGVDGRLTTRSYEPTDGGKRVYVTEVTAETVTFLEPKNSQGGGGNGNQGQNRSQNQNRPQNGQNGYNRNQNQNQNQNHPTNTNQNQNQNQNQSYYDDDPFANGSGGIDISDDDLPF